MKKVIIALAALIVTAAAYGQGTVQFNNRLTASGIDAKVLMPGGGTAVSDPAFKAQIYAGAEGSAVTALKAVPTTTTFRTGNAAGYINPVDVSIPGIAGGSKSTMVMRVYNGATYETSTIIGTSNPITITLGGAGSPPGPGAEMTGLTGFTLTLVPEPSTIALGILGVAALLFRRRK